MFLRQTPHIPLWSHAWIKLFFAIIACLLHYGFEIESVVQGILVTGATVISRDLIHNTIYGIHAQKSGMKWDPNKGVFIPKEEKKENDSKKTTG
ncbi:phage holin family protein [Bacillus sp. JJ1503]